ncbi:squamosa promoter-binding-like protein 16 [Coffea eugenioides]|uniref:squamosa promoter-binding-like protein 16 n=1 Tax=Coffea eugenioides TaxID=49369 RepID=UPI000F60D840|nr:squamosa promoter-binding-like protein 16 [Coffea eugenioides]XP_027153037.1 squamosa promoter-binding-like protein 16 [Coffea eugenioides]XP_027153038.1 squamosa promoter-binding-like protein 16 [Coffea eugenioides]
MESSSLTGSSKRAKAPGNVTQMAHCLVDGCNADLSQCRDYHRRHKVCEHHSKASKVTIGGRELRFCQQCSRFHSLGEFDEGKRSCRKRLDGHNRRRRKPQAELSRNSGMLFPSQQGSSRLLSFDTPQIFPSAVVSSSWSGVVKPENNVVLYCQSNTNYIDRQNAFPESVHDYKGVNQFQFIQSTPRTLPETSICQPLLDPDSASGHNNSSQKIFSDGLNQVINSDRALSLLSSAPAVTREIGFSHMVQPDSISQAQSLVHNLQYGSPGQFPYAQEIENKPVISESDSRVSNNATLHFQEMFQNGPEESSTSGGSQQTLTFLWE